MALDYFPWRHSYLKKCEKLKDQELGRLVRALTKYSETGERQELAGCESIAFDFIADDIDIAKGAYAEKCRKNRINGEAGTKANGTERYRTPPNGTERPRTVPNAPERYRTPPNTNKNPIQRNNNVLKEERGDN